jgi:hypothetical protein
VLILGVFAFATQTDSGPLSWLVPRANTYVLSANTWHVWQPLLTQRRRWCCYACKCIDLAGIAWICDFELDSISTAQSSNCSSAVRCQCWYAALYFCTDCDRLKEPSTNSNPWSSGCRFAALGVGIGYLITAEYLAPAYRDAAVPLLTQSMLPVLFSLVLVFLLFAYYPTPDTVAVTPYLYVHTVVVTVSHAILIGATCGWVDAWNLYLDMELGCCYYRFCLSSRRGPWHQSVHTVKVCVCVCVWFICCLFL